MTSTQRREQAFEKAILQNTEKATLHGTKELKSLFRKT